MSAHAARALLVVTVLASGCNTKDRRLEELQKRSDALAKARAEAAAARPVASADESRSIEENDVPSPAIDLAEEVAAYTDAAACAKRHRVTDPLVADGLEALGYDAFVRDGCRAIAALKTKDKLACAPILATPRRRACLADLAIATGDDSLCPTDDLALHFPAHDVSCLAGARRDVRPCAYLRGTERAACEGVVAHEPGRCGTDARCLRRVARWKTLLPTLPGKSPYDAKISGTLESIDEAAPGHVRRDPLSFAEEAAAGAVVIASADTVRILVGSVNAVPLDAERSASVGLALAIPKSALATGAAKITAANDGKTIVYLVNGLDLAADKAPEIELTTPIPDAVNEPVRFIVRAVVGPPNAPKHLEITVDTWLRDRVVIEAPAKR